MLKAARITRLAYMLTLDSRDTCGTIDNKKNENLNSKYQNVQNFSISNEKRRKGKTKRKKVCLFYTDIYERKRVRSGPQISRESTVGVI